MLIDVFLCCQRPRAGAMNTVGATVLVRCRAVIVLCCIVILIYKNSCELSILEIVATRDHSMIGQTSQLISVL
jgi:hypothetical protein